MSMWERLFPGPWEGGWMQEDITPSTQRPTKQAVVLGRQFIFVIHY